MNVGTSQPGVLSVTVAAKEIESASYRFPNTRRAQPELTRTHATATRCRARARYREPKTQAKRQPAQRPYGSLQRRIDYKRISSTIGRSLRRGLTLGVPVEGQDTDLLHGELTTGPDLGCKVGARDQSQGAVLSYDPSTY